MTSERKPRVGFDARWYNDSGVGTYVAELLRAMAPLQESFELLVYQDPRNKVPDLDQFPVKTADVNSKKYSLAEQIELPRLLRRDKVDLFHSPFYVMPLRAPCPVVVTMHDLIPFLFRIAPWPKQFLVKSGYRAAARRSAHIIADSENTAVDVQKILGVPHERVTPIHIAAQRQYVDAGNNPDSPVDLEKKFSVRQPFAVVASARNWRTKNLESALRALASASEQAGIRFQTLVYGPREGIDAAASAGATAGLDLRRLGYVPAEELAIIFRNAQVFVMPSLYEGFGLPIVEAMSCGCPVITSTGGSLAEVAGEGAQVFDPFDIAGMAASIAKIFKDPEELRRRRMSALVRASDFSWERTAIQTVSLYHRILRQTRTA